MSKRRDERERRKERRRVETKFGGIHTSITTKPQKGEVIQVDTYGISAVEGDISVGEVMWSTAGILNFNK